ncbi:alpha/beta hydrolase family protein [Saccharolobus islandicus]|uniref:DAP2, dipeptidyl aminopeptidase/acylaminoacylpeptidase n=1 Tax=Saccharolobus islandicus (strain REY15A) TaxID=930945 RepID=F0NBU1_SACI5|nr:S9 family peptidase [Sulfolobus islandicus]ADX85853.1 DAP2, dipeptidyl aminopeptidase/acylaminoacylpeptidase [Sulfolobus islandicus REY15A]
MEYSELVRILEDLVRLPIYGIIGKLKDTPILLSTVEGKVSISALIGDKLRVLTKESIASSAIPKSHLDFVPFTRDIEKGKELHSIHIVNLKGEEYEVASPKLRIFSLAYDEKNIAFIGSSQSESSLYVIEGGKIRKIANVPPFSFVTDLNGEYIIGSGVLKGNPKSQEFFVADLSGNIRIFTPKDGSINTAYYIKDNKIYIISDYENPGESYWVYTFDFQKYERVEFSEKDIYNYKAVELYYNPEDLLIIAKRDGQSKLFFNGKMLNTLDGTISGATKIGDNVYFAHSSLATPYRVYKLNLRNNKTEVIISNKEVDIGKVEYVKIRNGDIEVPTWIIRANKPTKIGIVYVHGGPWAEVDNGWDLLIAPLVYAGFNVVAPNYRGSTGYGSKFNLMDIGDPGGGDLSDVVRARDYAIENGIAEKIGIMGYSYGGYMTLLALGKLPDKWDFGIAGASVADWVEMYDLSDSFFKSFMEVLFMAKNLDLMKDRSPITYVNNVKAPLCIIHSQNDTRTPLVPVLRYVQELQKGWKTFEFHVIPNLGHTIYKIDDAIDLLLPALIFLKKLFG